MCQPGKRSAAEEAFIAIDFELESLALEESTLRDERALLAATRNHSTRLTGVNALPPEILARVFAFSKIYNYCMCDTYLEPDSFTSVCVYWRRVAMAATDLWTHVDIGPSTPGSLTRLLLERSKDTPIHVHVIEAPEDSEEYGSSYEEACESLARGIVVELEDHVHRLCTLRIESDGTEGEFISAMFDEWAALDNVGTLMSLSVIRPSSHGALPIPAPGETSDNLEKLLLPLNTLRLDCVTFDWASGAYRNLVDLRLSFFLRGVRVSMPQLFSILSACPTLHTLKLKNLGVDGAKGWIQPDPITMRYLKVLGLVGQELGSASSVLSLIALPEYYAELSLGFPLSGKIDNQLVNFFTRSKLATLYCYCHTDRRSHDWTYLLQHTPRFRTLVLEKFNLVGALKIQPDASYSLAELQSASHSVIFLRCGVDSKCLNELVVSSGIRDLRFELCSVSKASGEIEDLQASLLKICPELRCSLSDTDSTKRLACRMMFDN
ncbi:hypothetical protein FRC12_004981 [Ceratobasidium sp. 428]|nr:hypothetical protein FRC12_004981 [Ceratobasidium sp. 428]